MTIIKHSKFYSDKKEHIDLYGKCSRCECEFKTFIDLYWDVPDMGGATIVTDPDCKDMELNPEFDYDPYWIDGKIVIRSGISTLRTISGSIKCPDCGELTELKTERGRYYK